DPVLSAAPDDIVVQCHLIPVPAVLTATDNCDPAVQIVFSELDSDYLCDNSYTLTRTWTATDACGNSDVKVQIITVIDTTPPVLEDAPADITVQCHEVPVPADLEATDNCDDDVLVEVADV
ncbi:hypothetical protein RZS08_57790, partial [Arthrospira platensis SPKY1]|nr:hypothetical protein [Arthrospira platensis SPKY1]